MNCKIGYLTLLVLKDELASHHCAELDGLRTDYLYKSYNVHGTKPMC